MGMSQLVKFIMIENKEDMFKSCKMQKLQSDVVVVILVFVGVEYMYENLEVVGISCVEEKLL